MGAQRRLMVVGAVPGNLGMRVVEEAMRSREWATIRMYDKKDRQSTMERVIEYLDVTDRRQVLEALEWSPTDIVCTVGMNCIEPTTADITESMSQHLEVNTYGPMLLLSEALDLWLRRWDEIGAMPDTGFNFCAISSNSAHVARSMSAGYCASKAALSMGLRCVARRVAKTHVTVWGYEPGFLDGTPMSEHTKMVFSDVPLHRIPSGEGVPVEDLADRIVGDLIVASKAINGVMFRIDGGEQ